ncbi:MAG: efflux RND transporter periplasmic adaptor subunit [Thermodesulfobacteriota bacterium]
MSLKSIIRKARIAIVLGLSALIAVLLLALKPEAQRSVPEETGRLVEVASFQESPVPMVVEAFGTVKPCEILSLVAEVKGQIVHLDPAFCEGGFIPRGTAFIKIDPRTYSLEVERRKIQLQQSLAELSRLEQEVVNLQAVRRIARTDAGLCEGDLERSRSLFDRKILSRSDTEKTEQKYLSSLERLQGIQNQLALTDPMRQQLSAQRDMARVALKQAELDLEKTCILAPFDGYVLEKSVEAGQNVNAGQILGKIYRAGQLEVDVLIPMKDVRWLHEDLASIHAEIVFENGGSEVIFRGRASRLKARMEENTRTLPMVIAIDAKEPLKGSPGVSGLRPGMFVTARIKGRTFPKAFVLPRHAVHPGDVVYAVCDGRLKSKPVSVLRSYREHTVVADGIDPGDRIIVTPLPAATDGMKLRVKEDAASRTSRTAP